MGCKWACYWVLRKLGVIGCIIGCHDPACHSPDHPGILSPIAELDEFKGAWRALGILASEHLSALRRVATIESIGASTRIEGSKLSDREVEKLLSSLEIKSFHTRDDQEVAGYAETMELIFQSWEEITLTENHVKQMHRDLLKYSEKDAHHRGEYRTQPNSVAAFDETGKPIGNGFEAATPLGAKVRLVKTSVNIG